MIGTAALALFLSAAPQDAAPAPPPSPSGPPAGVLALVGGEPVTESDLEQSAGARLFVMRTQQYQAQRQMLDELIAKRLLDKEAAARKGTVDQLLQQEVEAKAAPVTEAEQKQIYEDNKARFGGLEEAEAIRRIGEGLRQQRIRDRREAFVGELRKRAGVRVLLDAPRTKAEAAGNPAKGPAGAPITIVEFSDFQCPYCSRVEPTLARLEKEYPGKIRLVFRDYPLTQIHPQALKAAEAAGCADEQGKFWPMHDQLFSHQDKLQAEDLKQLAAAAGLDPARFAECLDSGRRLPEIQKDQKEGDRLGVQSTPTFFVNGRLLVGAQPYGAFVDVIEEELAKAGSRAISR